MKPPKIDVCIEGYDTDQTDFYISNLIEQHDSDAKRLAELQKENERLRGEFVSLTALMKQMTVKLDCVNSRLAAIESALGLQPEQRTAPPASASAEPDEQGSGVGSAEVAEKLDGIRSSIGSLKAILNK